MKKNELSAKFSPYVASAIAEGFAPCMTELSGSYSGVLGSQIVLAKGRERIVMWMEEKCGCRLEDEPDTVTLFVARFALAKGETTEFHYMWPADWKKHLVAQMSFYEVSPRKTGWYVEDIEEARRAREVHVARYDHRFYSTRFREYEVTDKLLAIARRLNGFKTIRRENLHVYKTGGTWVFQNKKSHREACVGA